MTTVSETIPDALQPGVHAALSWFKQTQEHVFEVTGIVDPERSLAMESPRELRLVLCGDDVCEQRSFRVAEIEGGFEVEALAAMGPETATDGAMGLEGGSELLAELDPPPGARRNWLADVLRRHTFVVLVFYRGFW